MTSPSIRKANFNRRETPLHLFTVGQAVRLRDSFRTFPRTSEVYRITGTLPALQDSPQYRIRNDDERHERVAIEDNLELVRASQFSEGATLIERTFGHGQRTETQQSRNQETETGKSVAQA